MVEQHKPTADQDILFHTPIVREGSVTPEELMAILNNQTREFVRYRSNIIAHHTERGRSYEDSQFLYHTYLQILAERNSRADEVAETDVQVTLSLGASLHPLPTYRVSCIDSRVMATIVNGPSNIGGTTRVPAGDLAEVTASRDGGLNLIPNSYFDDLLGAAFKKHDVIAQILDCHRGCAAQGAEEKTKRGEVKDGGLYEDIRRKKSIAHAMVKHTRRKYPGKEAVPIITSFDPHSGFMYMGLELDQSMSQVTQGEGYTNKKLGELVKDGRVLYSALFLDDSKIIEAFRGRKIDGFSWEYNYKKTVIGYWDNLNEMIGQEEFLDYIAQNYLQKLYFGRSPEEIRERAMLLLTNAYNGFLNNTDIHGRYLDPHITPKDKMVYPYAEHKEACVVIGEGGNGPYGLNPSFSVFGLAIEHISENVKLAAGIVRDNRKDERVHDTTGIYKKDHKFFVDSPIPMLVQEVVRNHIDWEELRSIDWSDIVNSGWATDEKKFERYVRKKCEELKGKQIEIIYNLLESLRKKMVALYKVGSQTHQQLVDGNLDALPVLTDANRRVQCIVPFIYPGYEEEPDVPSAA